MEYHQTKQALLHEFLTEKKRELNSEESDDISNYELLYQSWQNNLPTLMPIVAQELEIKMETSLTAKYQN